MNLTEKTAFIDCVTAKRIYSIVLIVLQDKRDGWAIP